MPNDSQTVGDNPEFLRITEMPVDMLLIDSGIGLGMVGHQFINQFVWIGIRLVLTVGFCLFEQFALKFRVVFGNAVFN